MLKASAPFTPDEAAFDPPTPNVGASSPDTPQGGNDDQQPRSKSRRNEGSIIMADTPLSSLLQGATSSTTQAMDESAVHVPEQPDLKDNSRAPKPLRTNVISYSEMHEDMEPDCHKEFSVKESLVHWRHDIQVDDDVDWDEQDYVPLADPNVFPYAKEEPHLTEDQLTELDSIADTIEIQRLKTMGCLDGF